ncbi:MAG: DUF1428 domain-containing protein [Thermoanaerobaculia bacterium]
MSYVDGFVLPIPKSRLADYRKLSRLAGKVWLEHGALEYRECAGDDLRIKGVASFHTLAGCRRGETVVFSWISFKSRGHRDRVNALAIKDPRLAKVNLDSMPFDPGRMAYGGFAPFVDLPARSRTAAPRRKSAPARTQRKSRKPRKR